MNRAEREDLTRQARSQIRQIRKATASGNLFHAWDMLGLDIPKPSKKPVLSDYGITQDDIDRIPEERKLQEKRNRIQNGIVAGVCIAIGILFSIYYVFEAHDLSRAATPVEIAVLFGFHGFIGASTGGVLVAFMTATPLWKKELSKSATEKRYDEYQSDLNHYLYWEWKKQKTYWLSLSGEEFEYALGALYRDAGYQAEVTKAGGDHGIDIIVRMVGEPPFIVQCKAHKNKIGPGPIRDFYGTMVHGNYSRGVFASLSGFTNGAMEFASDKNIMLIDVDDIIGKKILP